jgi:citronellol/citronellal dehydrogenase
MTSLKDRTLFITGASRGIGLAIALKAARDGANIAIAAKTTSPHPKLEGTIYTAAEAVEAAGGRALPIKADIRDDGEVARAVEETVARFGGIDICINNASAISLTDTASTEMKRYDLMQAVNGRGTYLVSKLCLPHLLKRANPHILTLAPPINLDPKWFAPHLAYTMSKYAMSLATLGLAEEFRGRIAVNALWPRTTIATAAIRNIVGGEGMMRRSRTPEIMADAAYLVLTKPASFSGNFLIDEEVLQAHHLTDFSHYQYDPSASLELDLFLDRQP